MQDRRRVLVIGAGIGGLAAARALRRAGLDAHVFEQAAVLRAEGAAVTLHPPARWALAELVGKDAVDALGGLHNHRFALKTPRGRVLMSRPADAVTVARDDLVRVLGDALPDDVVHLGHGLAGLGSDETGVTARFQSGREERAAVLVGADGIHSAVRKHTLGASPPRDAGFAAWRSIASFTHPDISDGTAQIALGRGQRFGMIPMSHARVDWFAWCVSADPASQPSPTKETLTERFDGWFSPVAELIDATPEEEILTGRVYDRPPIERWSTGRVTLLGDAAHAALPSSGQGAGLAVEDALVLGEELSRADLTSGPAVAAALRAYETRRVPPTTAIVRRAWRSSRPMTWTNPILCWARDARILAGGMRARAR